MQTNNLGRNVVVWGVVSERVGPVEGQAAMPTGGSQSRRDSDYNSADVRVGGQDDIEGIYSNNGGQIWQL